MATLPQLESALKNAHAAGDVDAARKLANVVRKERERLAEEPQNPYLEQMPDYEPPQVPGTQPETPEPTIGERALGTGEAILTTGTGATSGTVGMLGGTLRGIADEILGGEFGTQAAAQRIQRQAMEQAKRFTYEPRTESGREQVQAVGEVGEALTPLAPMAAEIGGVARMAGGMATPAREGAAQAARTARETVKTRAQPVIERAAETAQAARARLPGGQKKTDTFGDDSAGAAALDRKALSRAKVEELDYPPQLLKGQETGKVEDIKFERETAKMPEGEQIRRRYEEQTEAINRNLDKWINDTGGKMTELGEVGELVQSVLKQRRAKDKNKVKVLYQTARKSPEGKRSAPADRKVTLIHDGDKMTTSVVNFLNDALEGVATSRLTDTLKQYGVRLGIFRRNEDGLLEANPKATVNDLEDFRVQINEKMPPQPSGAELRDATIMKKLIDGTTEPVAGPLFKRARDAQEKMYKDYERAGLVEQLVNTKKNSDDRKIAVEDVVKKVVLSDATSLEQMRDVRRLLQTKTGGKEGAGAQAWREIQAATLREIQDKMLRFQRDEAGNRMLSASQLDKTIKKLDRSGKLDFIFGGKGADKIITINEVAQIIENAPPGAINYSNTATVLAGLFDVVVSGTTGIPAPAASILRFVLKQANDRKLEAKIKEHLGKNI